MRRRWLVVLGALSAFGPLTTDAYLPGLPEVGGDLGVGESGVQVTLTACLVGLALGQLVVGPVSDALGRRRPLVAGMVLFALASAACALAPTILVLDVARLVQGLAGAAGIVIARAMVRDTSDGIAAARTFSTLGAAVSTGPILAPLIGAPLLEVGSWRLVFWFLTALGLMLLVAVAAWTRETLPPARRRSGGLGEALRSFRVLLGERRFMGYALAGGLAFGALFAYISTASFVYQDVFGFSPLVFGLLFGVNGCGILGASLLNGRLLSRLPPERMLGRGLLALVGATAVLTGLALAGAGAALLLPVLWVAVSSAGFVSPNTVALGMQDAGERAGSAAALLGILQFALGAMVAPLTGLLGPSTVTMAATMVGLAAAAWLALRLLAPPLPTPSGR